MNKELNPSDSSCKIGNMVEVALTLYVTEQEQSGNSNSGILNNMTFVAFYIPAEITQF